MAQFDILNFLSTEWGKGNKEHISISAIAHATKTDIANASGQLKKLLEYGAVERDMPFRRCAYRIKPTFYEHLEKNKSVAPEVQLKPMTKKKAKTSNTHKARNSSVGEIASTNETINTSYIRS